MDPPKDAGMPSWRHKPIYGVSEDLTTDKAVPQKLGEMGKDGYIKISCELFPETQMNLRWCMDALRKLVKEANVRLFPSCPSTIIQHSPEIVSNVTYIGTRHSVIACFLYRYPSPNATSHQ
jgi:small subunit ribosomal protein S35